MSVTIFSTTSCAICHSQMQWMDRNNIAYNNVVIDESDENMQKMIEATNGQLTGTPFTVIDQDGTVETVSGFDRKKLSGLLGVA